MFADYEIEATAASLKLKGILKKRSEKAAPCGVGLSHPTLPHWDGNNVPTVSTSVCSLSGTRDDCPAMENHLRANGDTDESGA